MFGLGAGELLVILVIAFLVLGPTQLPKLMKDVGKAIREVRKAADDVRQEIVVDDELRRPFEELREAVSLSPEELRRREEASAHAPATLPVSPAPAPALPRTDGEGSPAAATPARDPQGEKIS